MLSGGFTASVSTVVAAIAGSALLLVLLDRFQVQALCHTMLSDAFTASVSTVAAAIAGSALLLVLLDRFLATNRRMPRLRKPYGVFNGGVLWNAATAGRLQSSEAVGGATTVHELMDRAFGEYGPMRAVGKRPILSRRYEVAKHGARLYEKLTLGDYAYTSYSDYRKQVAQLGAGMVEFAKLVPGDKIVIYAETSLEWMLSCLAAFSQSLTVVTIYATLGEEGLAQGLAQTHAKLLVADARLLPKVARVARAAVASCARVVYVAEVPVLARDAAAENTLAGALGELEAAGWEAAELGHVMGLGLAHPAPAVAPSPDDTALIMFTSGTTGAPKGVVISHSNLLHAVVGTIDRLRCFFPPGEQLAGATYLAYLPLAHSMEFSVELACLASGCVVGYGSPHTLTRASPKLDRRPNPGGGPFLGDAEALRPSSMMVAPAVVDKIRAAVEEQMAQSNWVVRALYRRGLASGAANWRRGVIGSAWLYDRLVFRRIQRLLGGRLRMVGSGAAPLSSASQVWFQTVFNAATRQGYGLTETCATSCMQLGCDNSVGVVGPPTSACCLKLRDWGHYRSADADDPAIGAPRGEVLLGGPSVCMGYHVDAASPAAAELRQKNADEFSVGADGVRWFETGDIGQVTREGSLQIIDRKKDLVKLQQGEYVALSKVENALKACPLVEVALVYARPSESYCVALICPSHAELARLAEALGCGGRDVAALCADPCVRDEALRRCVAACEGSLAAFEIPRRVALVAEAWTPESGLVSESLKLKRKLICEKHARELDDMYGGAEG